MGGVKMKNYTIRIASGSDLGSVLKGLVNQPQLNVKIQCSKKQISRLKEEQAIDESLSEKAKYFTFLNDRGLL